MATMKSEEPTKPTLVTTREPTTPKRAGDKGSMGDQALMDALLIVGVAWAILIGLMLTLRDHNI